MDNSKLFAVLFGLFWAIVPISWAHANPSQTITLSTQVSPQYVSGNLIGCQISFEAVRNDPEYSEGRYVYLTGNLSYLYFEGKDMILSLKLGVKGLEENSSFLAPNEVYLMNGHETNKADFLNSNDSGEGFKIFAFSFSEIGIDATISSISKNENFTFSYAMTPGGLNAIVPINLRVEKEDLSDSSRTVISDRNPDEWKNCMSSTLKAAKMRLK